VCPIGVIYYLTTRVPKEDRISDDLLRLGAPRLWQAREIVAKPKWSPLLKLRVRQEQQGGQDGPHHGEVGT
jgi:hypothetical protein